jgi:hypothetical protein
MSVAQPFTKPRPEQLILAHSPEQCLIARFSGEIKIQQIQMIK